MQSCFRYLSQFKNGCLQESSVKLREADNSFTHCNIVKVAATRRFERESQEHEAYPLSHWQLNMPLTVHIFQVAIRMVWGQNVTRCCSHYTSTAWKTYNNKENDCYCNRLLHCVHLRFMSRRKLSNLCHPASWWNHVLRWGGNIQEWLLAEELHNLTTTTNQSLRFCSVIQDLIKNSVETKLWYSP